MARGQLFWIVQKYNNMISRQPQCSTEALIPLPKIIGSVSIIIKIPSQNYSNFSVNS